MGKETNTHGGKRPGAGRPKKKRSERLVTISFEVSESVRDDWNKHRGKTPQPQAFKNLLYSNGKN